MFYSPLRYPGGKNKLAEFIGKVCVDNSVSGHYVEPYAGGASVALHLLFEGKVKEITINDLDRSIYAIWWSILNQPEKLCNLIEETEITMANWRKVNEVQNNKEDPDLLDLGFAALFLNRTNYSGIIDAGPIGGMDQESKYKLDCRFNKKTIISRIERIAENADSIHLYNMDALDLINKLENTLNSSDSIFYLDPPYYVKGPDLYMNSYDDKDHRNVADKIKNMQGLHWIVSYDNRKEIKAMYNWMDQERVCEFNLSYSARKAKSGEEVMFLSPSLEEVDFGVLKEK